MPIQLLSPIIFTGREFLIVPYSIAVTFWVSEVFTFVGEVVEQEYIMIKKIDNYNKELADNIKQLLAEIGENMGFQYVASGPLVRSSYKAAEFYIEKKIRDKGCIFKKK